MFTGIIAALGTLIEAAPHGENIRMRVDAGAMPLDDVKAGDSVAVNGVCLTATEIAPPAFAVDVSPETLRCTTLGALQPGSRVNLEKALALGERLGGHLVTGHIDGVGRIRDCREEGGCLWIRIQVPAELARYVSRKGSVCVDGVSLTVNNVEGAAFEVQIIPHTRAQTLFGVRRPGGEVNIEVDIIARYVESLLRVC